MDPNLKALVDQVEDLNFNDYEEDDSKEMFKILLKSKNILHKPNEESQTRTSSRF